MDIEDKDKKDLFQHFESTAAQEFRGGGGGEHKYTLIISLSHLSPHTVIRNTFSIPLME